MMDDPNVDGGKPHGGRSPTHPEDQPSSKTWASVERKDQPCVGEEARESSFLISEQRKAPVEYVLGNIATFAGIQGESHLVEVLTKLSTGRN